VRVKVILNHGIPSLRLRSLPLSACPLPSLANFILQTSLWRLAPARACRPSTVPPSPQKQRNLHIRTNVMNMPALTQGLRVFPTPSQQRDNICLHEGPVANRAEILGTKKTIPYKSSFYLVCSRRSALFPFSDQHARTPRLDVYRCLLRSS